MSDTVIKVEGLGKKYIIGHQTGLSRRQSYKRFSDVVLNAAKAPLGWLNAKNQEQRTQNSKEDFWALNDVSFEIKRGDVVGIIGRNGAGKSTLLKILSRITEPTTGRIEIDGRVASLLEVGTGFHPELTGRENIYLNGAILGMTRAEIRGKYDEIVAFAEVEKFLDTPVKRYSSGMYVRLAFAVAAHLEPEILIVDEVLAVGDAQFQKKCLGRMQTIAGHGRTVLFVSHNMAAIENLCKTGLLMQHGRLIEANNIMNIIGAYTKVSNDTNADAILLRSGHRTGTGTVIIKGFSIKNSAGEKVDSVPACSSITLEIAIGNETNQAIPSVSLGYSIESSMGVSLAVAYSDYENVTFTAPRGNATITIHVPELPLAAGAYLIGLRLISGGTELDWPRTFKASLLVEGGVSRGHASTPHSGRGYLLLKNDWSIRSE